MIHVVDFDWNGSPVFTLTTPIKTHHITYHKIMYTIICTQHYSYCTDSNKVKVGHLQSKIKVGQVTSVVLHKNSTIHVAKMPTKQSMPHQRCFPSITLHVTAYNIINHYVWAMTPFTVFAHVTLFSILYCNSIKGVLKHHYGLSGN